MKCNAMNLDPVGSGTFSRIQIHIRQAVLWIRIRIGSVFRSFLDPDSYSEYGFGSKFNVFRSTTLL